MKVCCTWYSNTVNQFKNKQLTSPCFEIPNFQSAIMTSRYDFRWIEKKSSTCYFISVTSQSVLNVLYFYLKWSFSKNKFFRKEKSFNDPMTYLLVVYHRRRSKLDMQNHLMKLKLIYPAEKNNEMIFLKQTSFRIQYLHLSLSTSFSVISAFFLDSTQIHTHCG